MTRHGSLTRVFRLILLVACLPWAMARPAQAAAKAQAVQNTVSSTAFRAFCVEEIYQKLLGRAPSTPEAAPLVAQLQADGKAWQQVVVVVAGSPAYFQKTGRNPTGFVNQLFKNLVGRAPDATEELPASVDFLKTNGRDKLASIVADTEEFRAFWTQNFYQTWLGRAASPTEATTGAAQLDEGGISALAASVLGSSGYFQQVGGSQSGWQNAVNRTLQGDGVGGGMGEMSPQPAPVDDAAPGMPHNSRAPMVQALLSSPEYQAGTVQSFYQKFLGRAATPAELSQGTGALQNGASLEQVVLAVLTSDEYFNRAGGTTNGFLKRLSQDLLGKGGNSSNKKTTDDLLSKLRKWPDRFKK